MTGPYREQEMTPPPSRWVRFWEQMAKGHAAAGGGGYFFVACVAFAVCVIAGVVTLIRIDAVERAARIQAEYDASHLTGEECLTECAAAGMRVDWYKPSTQECGCKR